MAMASISAQHLSICSIVLGVVSWAMGLDCVSHNGACAALVNCNSHRGYRFGATSLNIR